MPGNSSQGDQVYIFRDFFLSVENCFQFAYLVVTGK